MNSVVSRAWKRRHASVYCGWVLPSGRHRSAQVVEPVRPEDQTPLPVQGLDAAVRAAQVVDESLEDAVVAEQPQAGFVVDLEPDDGRMVGVPGDDRAGHALGVEQEAGMGVVRLLPAAPAHPLTGAELPGDLGVPAGQPRGHRVRRGAEDDAIPRSWAPSRTGWSQSRSNWPSSGSHVDQTDSPTRMTVKPAAAIRSRSVLSRSYGWYSW